MESLEQNEFQKMVAFSTGVHFILFGAVLLSTSFSTKRYIEMGSLKPMNVMWAKAVRRPKVTAPDKLPGPIVPLPAKKVPKAEKPKFVLKKKTEIKSKTLKKNKIDLKEEARQKAIAEAVAAVRKNIDDQRPLPRADNFPSQGGAEKGLPAGPSGGGKLGGNPAFSSYKNRIRKIVTDNFVWIQKQTRLKAEVTFTMDIQGNVVNPKVTKSSGNFGYDQAALRAVRKSSPLPNPPSSIARDLRGESFVIVFDPKR